MDTTSPQTEAPGAGEKESSSPHTATPTTYEACLAVAQTAAGESDPSKMKAALNALAAFFSARIEKKQQRDLSNEHDRRTHVADSVRARRSSFRPERATVGVITAPVNELSKKILDK